MKYYIVAGEASGDLHGANLMKAVAANDTEAHFRCWGGDLMQAAGGVIVKHYRDLAFMGFWEVAAHLHTILHNIAFFKKDMMQYKPDVLILIDYPGFNLRVAKFAKKNNIKVIYYISPQIWAWKKNRIHAIKKYVDEMLVILPFEESFYQQYHVSVHYVGHPLLDAITDDVQTQTAVTDFKKINNLDNRDIIALLPGSRKQEIKQMLPIMLSVVEQYPQYRFVVSGVSSQPRELYDAFLHNTGVPIVFGQTYPLILNAKAALVTSGTATLETALLNTPQVVCYKGSAFSYHIARLLVKNIRYISLVNLIMDYPVVTELIQHNLTTKNLTAELNKLLCHETREKMLQNYAQLHNILGNSKASDKAAQIIDNFLHLHQ